MYILGWVQSSRLLLPGPDTDLDIDTAVGEGKHIWRGLTAYTDLQHRECFYFGTLCVHIWDRSDMSLHKSFPSKRFEKHQHETLLCDKTTGTAQQHL